MEWNGMEFIRPIAAEAAPAERATTTAIADFVLFIAMTLWLLDETSHGLSVPEQLSHFSTGCELFIRKQRPVRSAFVAGDFSRLRRIRRRTSLSYRGSFGKVSPALIFRRARTGTGVRRAPVRQNRQSTAASVTFRSSSQ